jgi:predicted XRE-type DNA-binding protein
VKHGTNLDYEGLQREAKRTMDQSAYTQEAIAEQLGVARSSVAKAVTQVGPKFQQLQMRILEALTDFEVERREQVEFVVREKSRADRDQ